MSGAVRPDHAAILDNLYDGVYFVDTDRVITYWNKGAERITGYRAEEVIGRSCGDGILNHVAADGTLLCTHACPLAATMTSGVPMEADVFLHHADGHRLPVLVRGAPLHDARGEVIGAVETFSTGHSVRRAHRELDELRRAVRTDPLTGVGNRTHLEGRLRGLVAEYAERPGEAAVVLADIDRFKSVNDTYGHATGDRVLRMVASTLRSTLREGDTVGRWGGEEFVVLLDDVRSADDLRRVAEKLRTLVGRSSLPTDAGDVAVTISVGATLLREGDTPAALVERADRLLYRSKHAGRDRVSVD
jgi:diguanylate cyclase (GGDEF)-like protein/PAS domain S-box-containing protein